MVYISKPLFYEKAAGKCCRDFYHPNTGCMWGIYGFVLDVLIGSSKFYLVIYTAQALLNWKVISYEYFQKLLVSYGRSLIYGVCFCTLLVSTICMTNNIFGRLLYYNVGFLSGIIGGLAIFLESKQNRILNTIIFFSTSVEAFINYLDYANFMKRTPVNTTFLFMALNGYFMYLLTTKKSKGSVFWFYSPPYNKTNEDAASTKCLHEESCQKFFLKGFSRFFLIGYLISVAKTLLPKLLLVWKFPKLLLKIIFKKNNFLFGLLLGAYVGIHSLTTCFLLRVCKETKWWHNMAAGVLSGSALAFKPKIQLLALLVTNVCQLSAQKVIKPGTKIPFVELLFALCDGYLLHMRLMNADCCPKYYTKMVNNCTNGVMDNIYNLIMKMVGLA